MPAPPPSNSDYYQSKEFKVATAAKAAGTLLLAVGTLGLAPALGIAAVVGSGVYAIKKKIDKDIAEIEAKQKKTG